MMQPFNLPNTVASVTSIVPAINKDTKVTIDNDTLAKLYLVQQRAPANTCWVGKASATDNGWHISDIQLFAQRPADGPTLPPVIADSEIRVWGIKSSAPDLTMIPDDGYTLLLSINNGALTCALALPSANQILSNIPWKVTGNDPYAILETEITAEMALKVSKISYSSGYNKTSAYTGSAYGARNTTASTSTANKASATKATDPWDWDENPYGY